jgi:RNA polymerase sigma-70 factor (ECF subfamily)
MQNYNEKSDSELLALSIDHPSAFALLVDRYQKEFLRKITYILKNKEEAEDIVQDSFVKIYLNAHRFKVQDVGTFKSWAYRILLNTCYTYCKKKKREKLFVQYVEDDAELVHVSDEAEKKLNLDYVLSIISKIPVALGRIMKLNLIEGKTYEDIAEVEGISVGAVRTRMHRAKLEFKNAENIYAK